MSWKETLQRTLLIALVLSLPAIPGLAQAPQGKRPREPWAVPDKFKKVHNPLPTTRESIESGEVVYVKECLTCHGPTGAGDGPRADYLEGGVPSLRTTIAEQTDGELYYKVSSGRKPMPEFVKTLKPADRWNVINYIRMLQVTPQRWAAPDTFRARRNQVARDSASIKVGQKSYAAKCASCHGKSGDGEETKKLGTSVGDLRKGLADHSDGELFWKLLEGHEAAMETLRSLGDKERWHLINYVRTLGEQPAAARSR
jgi:mono/diheme cytochrome c family protein